MTDTRALRCPYCHVATVRVAHLVLADEALDRWQCPNCDRLWDRHELQREPERPDQDLTDEGGDP